MHKAEMPVDKLPVILFTLLNAPAIVFFNKLPAPLTIPKPPSKGP